MELLSSGQQSTFTGTLVGQIVMEGFLLFCSTPWKRRLITLLLAIVPAISVITVLDNIGRTPLLVGSQVVLTMQLPFAVFLLVYFTSDVNLMKEFVSSRLAKVCATFFVIA